MGIELSDVFNIGLDLGEDFVHTLYQLKYKYGERFDIMNGFHNTNLNFTSFIDNFIDSDVLADVTIDANANSATKDIQSLEQDMVKPHKKLLAYNKIFYEIEKKYGKDQAKLWLEMEWSGALYLHDAPSSTFVPYCFSGETKIMTKEGIKRLDSLVDEKIKVLNKNKVWENATVKCYGKAKLKKLTLSKSDEEKEIYVTGNHKWFVLEDSDLVIKETKSLEKGMIIPNNKTQLTHKLLNYIDVNKVDLVTLEEQELFERIKRDIPLTEKKWGDGYYALYYEPDNKNRLDYIRDTLCKIGIQTNSAKYIPEYDVYELVIYNESTEYNNWSVVSVEDTDREELVYCAEVKGTKSFTLENNILTHNCYAYSLEDLANKGLFFIDKFNADSAKHLTTWIRHTIEFISYASNRCSGAVGVPDFLIYTYYFWKKDVENGYYVKDPETYRDQAFQEFIYSLNQPYLRLTQPAFTNMSIMDRNYLVELFGGKQFPDGSFIIDSIDDIQEFQKDFMNVVSKIRSEKMMTFPVLTYSLLYQNGKFVDEDFAKWCCAHNMQWNDSNFYMGSDVTSLSNCCRLISDTSKLDAFINSIGGTALSIGSIKVNTINLRRISLMADGDKDKFLEILEEHEDACIKTLDIVRGIIKRNVDKGLLRNYSYKLIEMEKQYNTVGITALYEVINDFGLIDTDEFGNKSYSDEGLEFASVILDKINQIKDSYDFDYSINVECIPAERANVVLCDKDHELYPDKVEEFIYSNQWIPLMEKCTIDEKIKLGSLLDKKCGGGQISHINLQAPMTSEEQAWELLNKIAQAGVIYFAYNIKISVCKNEHGFIGDICPQCGEPVVDTYQRIVGYLVPSKAYSKERRKEFQARKWFDLTEI